MIPRTMKAPISIRTVAPATADARNSSPGSMATSIADVDHALIRSVSTGSCG